MKTKILFNALIVTIFSCALFAQQPNMEGTRSKTDPVKTGEMAPDFTLKDENGKTVKLSNMKQPVVIVFYRAYW